MCRSSGDKFSQWLLIWKCIYFAFILKSIFFLTILILFLWLMDAFSFVTLNILFYCLLVFIVSEKKSAVIFINTCLNAMRIFSLVAFKIFLLYFISAICLWPLRCMLLTFTCFLWFTELIWSISWCFSLHMWLLGHYFLKYVFLSQWHSLFFGEFCLSSTFFSLCSAD